MEMGLYSLWTKGLNMFHNKLDQEVSMPKGLNVNMKETKHSLATIQHSIFA